MNVEMCEDVINGVWVNNREQNIQLLILFSCDFGIFVVFVCQMVPFFSSHFLFWIALITNISNDSISIFQSSSRFQSEFVTFSVLNHIAKKNNGMLKRWVPILYANIFKCFQNGICFPFFSTKMIIWSYGRRVYTNNTRAFIADIHTHTFTPVKHKMDGNCCKIECENNGKPTSIRQLSTFSQQQQQIILYSFGETSIWLINLCAENTLNVQNLMVSLSIGVSWRLCIGIHSIDLIHKIDVYLGCKTFSREFWARFSKHFFVVLLSNIPTYTNAYLCSTDKLNCVIQFIKY